MHRKFHDLDSRERVGRFSRIPAFQKEDEERYWKEFADSFLQGEDRGARLKEIIETTREEFPVIVDNNQIDWAKAKLVALGGSSFYGPRRPDSRLTDIDLHLLLDEHADEQNFEIFPGKEDDSFLQKYHIMGTGDTDSARGDRNEIHWLLYPHYPIINKLEDGELKVLTAQLSEDTLNRKDEIEDKIIRLQEELRKEEGQKILDKYD